MRLKFRRHPKRATRKRTGRTADGGFGFALRLAARYPPPPLRTVSTPLLLLAESEVEMKQIQSNPIQSPPKPDKGLSPSPLPVARMDGPDYTGSILIHTTTTREQSRRIL